MAASKVLAVIQKQRESIAIGTEIVLLDASSPIAAERCELLTE